jgi:uncharacterized protein YaiI (UPF0178 family)
VKIWVDADACPGVIKEILYRAAERAQVALTLIANRDLQTPRSPWIKSIRVGQGFDVADRRIAELAEAGDLVITADVPLAADVIANGAQALSPRGHLFDEENIGEALAMRDLKDQLRSSGVDTGGPPALGKKDRQAFANGLDRILTKRGQV